MSDCFQLLMRGKCKTHEGLFGMCTGMVFLFVCLSLGGFLCNLGFMEMYANKTNNDSTFVRFKHNGCEYKVEVFDDTVCLHVYSDGEKEASYYVDIPEKQESTAS